jgi:hypothetical protein
VKTLRDGSRTALDASSALDAPSITITRRVHVIASIDLWKISSSLQVSSTRADRSVVRFFDISGTLCLTLRFSHP